MKRLFGAFGLFVLLAAGFAPTHAQDEPLKIVASFSILADVVKNIAGDSAEVVSLIPPDADPHAFQPAPQDVALLAEADVIFINGANLEEGLLEVIENAGEKMNLVVISQCVPILPGVQDHTDGEAHNEVDMSEIAVLCEKHHEEIGEAETPNMLYALDCGHEEESDDHGACDPHVWTDPQNVILWTLFIRDALIQLDPGNADTYTANAAVYIQQLDALVKDEILPALAAIPEENRVLVTNHESMGYFAAAYGFEIAGTVIPSSSTLAEPSAGDIARLIDVIEANDIKAIFAEVNVNADLVQQVSDESGAEFYVLYHTLSNTDGPASTYLDMMRYNVQTIVTALSK